MNDDDLIRRGDAAKICDDEAALYASKADAAAASVAAGETTNEPFFVACMLASIRLRAAAEEIRSLPAVAREPEAAWRNVAEPDPSPRCSRCARPDHGSVACEVVVSPARCARCGWPLAASEDEGCVPGNCSYRPREPLPPSRTVAEALAEATPSPPTCATCNRPYDVPDGTIWKPCPACAGRRRAEPEPCPACAPKPTCQRCGGSGDVPATVSFCPECENRSFAREGGTIECDKCMWWMEDTVPCPDCAGGRLA